jgi:HAD superfamily hydrolase (TIGR01509 family)
MAAAGSRFDAILFDFDGVLADTEPLHFAAWRELIPNLDWQTFQAHGLGRTDAALLEALGLGSLACRLPEKRRRFVELALAAGSLAPPVVALVKSLAEFRLAVVTSSDRSEVEPLLDAAGVRDCFAALVCLGDAARPKPAPDPYLRAAALLGATRPLVVEDSEPGVTSARAAGFDAIPILSPLETPRAVRAALGISA